MLVRMSRAVSVSIEDIITHAKPSILLLYIYTIMQSSSDPTFGDDSVQRVVHYLAGSAGP
jgi:hypothetical protein